MKKIIFLIIVFPILIVAQTNTFPDSGNVGIGTINTSGKLTIKTISSNSNGYGGIRLLGDSVSNLRLGINNDYSWIQSHGSTPLYINELGNNTILNLNRGSVGIGTTTTGSHKLAVEGSIGAREVKVEASGWSDFVFEENYNLPTLAEVEKHIKEKGHLQDIPSAVEVEKNGINLGEMDAKLLQKIEELMLYTIEQQKAINELTKSNKKQQLEINSLKNQLDKVNSYER